MMTKFDIEKFDGRNDFNIWRVKMRAVLVQHGWSKALKGKDSLPATMSDEEKDELMEKAHSAILLCLSNEVLREVVEEDTVVGLWLKLESLYLKKRLFTLHMQEEPTPPPGIASNTQPSLGCGPTPSVPPSTSSSLGSKRPLPSPSPGSSFGFTKSSFTYEELAMATDGFSDANLLGQGGFGYVHKGVLPDGKQVAIKQLKAGSGQGEREFQAEVEIISRVHHKHLVSLVGYCISGAQRMLVYEFVPNNTLEFHLHGKGRQIMSWANRMKIALTSAKGLAYLHEDCQPKIIHRDIKAANILLDDNFESKVADFGLARFFSDVDTHVFTQIMGTFGYLDPEYGKSGKLTIKSDIYSFGVVLLELVTGRWPIFKTQSSTNVSVVNLVNWVTPSLKQALEDGKFDTLVDPRLQKNYNFSEMNQMVACAAACVDPLAQHRPQMSQIVRALEGNISLNDLTGGIRPGHITFTYEELSTATDGFSNANFLSQGGFGNVHKGVLPNGKEVAIKRLKACSRQGEREFLMKIEIISRIHHRHLVSLVGYCISGTRRMLVYEFVPNKTLEFHLHGKGMPTMSWATRKKIAVGSAKVLTFLHENCQPRIIHHNIKAANILLDYNFEVKVADFGLPKLIYDPDTHIVTKVKGTSSYIDLEYDSSGMLINNSDIYSFGVVLLELITGRRHIVKTKFFTNVCLVNWAKPLLTQVRKDGNFDTLVDPRLKKKYHSSEMAQMVACANACVDPLAQHQPQMSQIVRALEGDISWDDLPEGIRPGHITFTYEELSTATDGFSNANLLGQGGFCNVHKGVLPNGKQVAIKQLKAGSGQEEHGYLTDSEIISGIHHRHLVSLVGNCIHGTRRMLVYEFVPNNTLEFHLHGEGKPTMSWETRMKIALGSAKGLAFLHEDCQPKIIHGDIKPADILLDYNFEAKVADFGLAKFSFYDNDTPVSTPIMGTWGYMAPEYCMLGKLTTKSDVYSFGVMLVELMTGCRPYDQTKSFTDNSMFDRAKHMLTQAWKDSNFDTLVDPRLQKNYNSNLMNQMVACAVACVHPSAEHRPQMSQIVRVLEGSDSVDDLLEGITSWYNTEYDSSGNRPYTGGNTEYDSSGNSPYTGESNFYPSSSGR